MNPYGTCNHILYTHAHTDTLSYMHTSWWEAVPCKKLCFSLKYLEKECGSFLAVATMSLVHFSLANSDKKN